MRQLCSVALSLNKPPVQAWPFLSMPPPLHTPHTLHQGSGFYSVSWVFFCLEPGVYSGGLFPLQHSKAGLLVRATCGSLSLEYTLFSWGHFLAFKDPFNTLSSRNACQPLTESGALSSHHRPCASLCHIVSPSLPLPGCFSKVRNSPSHIR